MKKYIYPLFIAILLISTQSLNAQIKVNNEGQVKIFGDRESDDPNLDLSMQVYGRYGDYLTNGRIGIGDYGQVSRNGSNIFIGELGTNWDSDRLQLHGKKGVYLTWGRGYDYNEIIGKWDINEPDRFKFEVDVYAKGVLLTSDERFKDNVKPLGKKLDKLKKLKGVSYKYKNKDKVPYNTNSNLSEKEQADIDLMGNMKKEDRTRIGFLAQDVESLFPELVEEDKAGYKYVDYVGLIPVLVESVKEQQEQIDELLKLATKKGLITNKN